jgi:hypothetical protein
VTSVGDSEPRADRTTRNLLSGPSRRVRSEGRCIFGTRVGGPPTLRGSPSRARGTELRMVQRGKPGSVAFSKGAAWLEDR